MRFFSSLLRYAPVWLPALLAGFVAVDLWWSPVQAEAERKRSEVPFRHALHGDSLGFSCAQCHGGVMDNNRAGMPSKRECLDCHRVPVSESKGLALLDSALLHAPKRPWDAKSRLPDHVRFHHALHASAGLSCVQCHGSGEEIDAGRRASVNMESCVSCHRKSAKLGASTSCSECHR